MARVLIPTSLEQFASGADELADSSGDGESLLDKVGDAKDQAEEAKEEAEEDKKQADEAGEKVGDKDGDVEA